MKFMSGLILIGFSMFLSPSAFAAAAPVALTCKITYVNASINDNLYEEGLAACGTDGDGDSKEVQIVAGRRAAEVSIGQMRFTKGDNASVSVRRAGTDLVAVVAPNGEEYTLSFNVYKDKTGTVWIAKKSSAGRSQQLARFDCNKRCNDQ